MINVLWKYHFRYILFTSTCIGGVMYQRIPVLPIIVILSFSLIHTQTITSTPIVATYNNIGIQVHFSAPVAVGAISVSIKESAGSGSFVLAHPLAKIGVDRFAGSVFTLKSGTSYTLKLTSSLFPADQILSVSTRPENFINMTATVFHVSPQGLDTNDGSTLQKAFKTLGHAVSVVLPGSTILLHEGRYYESVVLPRSGNANNPILIRNAPGERPVLDGRDTSFHPIWSLYNAAGHIYRTPYATKLNLAYYNGLHLYCSQTLADLVANTFNMPGAFFTDGAYLYVLFPSKSAPTNSDTVSVPAKTLGISSSQSYITFLGLEICYYGQSDYSAGIYLDNASYNRVDSCYLHHSVIGVGLKRASDFNTIQNCRFFEGPIDAWPWEGVKSATGYYEAGGVVIYSSNISNSGNVIRFNAFNHMFDGSHLYSEDAPTTNLDFHDNTMNAVNDDCIETDGAGINNRIYNNRFSKFLTGVSIAPAAIGPTYIFRNLFTGWENHSGYDGYPFKFNVSSALTIDWVYMYHNTCYTSVANQDGFLFKQYSNWNNIISRNNIFSGTNYALESSSSQNPVDFDYDDLYTSRPGRFINWAGANYTTLNAFTTATSQEKHGMNIDPGFVNPTNMDFSLDDSSKLIDKGIRIPGINDGFAGAAPDIGFIETGKGNGVLNGDRPMGAKRLIFSTNPFNHTLHIQIAGWTPVEAGHSVLRICTLKGWLVKEFPISEESHSIDWNIAGIPHGIYLAQSKFGSTFFSILSI